MTGGPLVARVLPDVSGLDKTFDYLVPDALIDTVVVGSLVRVVLHGRRVGGWVVSVHRQSEVPIDRLSTLTKWSSIGPSAEIVELARWAAQRWGSRRLVGVLGTASPPRMVRSLPPTQRGVAPSPSATNAVHRLPPTVDPLPLVVELLQGGPGLVLHPSPAAVGALARRLRAKGYTVAALPEQWAEAAAGVDVVVGSRGAAFGPCPDLRVAVVLDEHDETYQEERSPTWHAREVVIERCKRQGAACHLVSPTPSVAAMAREWRVHSPSAHDERAAWPMFEVVDRSDQPPWKASLLSSELIRELRSARRVACVINRTGRAKLSACRGCQTLQRCERCAAAVHEDREGRFVCDRCSTARPKVCQRCGSTAMANVKPGVARLREELQAAAQRPVAEVSADSVAHGDVDVYVGTEAVLHRVGAVDVVAFLDIDAELLAPRFAAHEHSLALLVRAARMVGPRARGGRVLLQTHSPDHPVLRAMQLADPQRAIADDVERRRQLGLPPFVALGALTGAGARQLALDAGLEPAGTDDDVLVRHTSWEELGRRLAAAPRPKGSRVRVEVDPPRR
jgi:primosomal protein N' (replication factor Y)